LYTTLFKYLMILLLKPWLRPKPGCGLELEMALALACVFQSQSHSKPGQSHGFQAKPGWHITSDNCPDLVVTQQISRMETGIENGRGMQTPGGIARGM
jgi:hypothetical protein